jgi:hypothetical protein
MQEPDRPSRASERLFSTEHLTQGLQGRSIRSRSLTLTAQASRFALQMGPTIVRARLLTPAAAACSLCHCKPQTKAARSFVESFTNKILIIDRHGP